MNLLRILTIDKCLQDISKKWTLQDLIAACEHTERNSKRSVQADIELMRNTEIGYSAPIMVVDKKYYTYSNKKYRLLKHLLTENDKKNIEMALEVIHNYCYFEEIKPVKDNLLLLHTSIADIIKIKNPVFNENFLPKEPIEIRLWIDSSIAEKTLKDKIHQTQRLEQEEIDGSLNIYIKMPFTSKLEKLITESNGKIILTSPSSLKKHINNILKYD